MASVYFDPAVGGDGTTVTDDNNATTGLGNGGHRTRFVPALAQMVAIAQYIANVAAGVSNAYFTPVRAATTANITLSGTQTIDGVALIAGDRVLVKDQSTGSQNGIYVVASGVWARATDADGSAEWKAGKAVAINEGSTHADTVWLVTNDGTITIGTTALAFARFPSLGKPNTWTALQTFTAGISVTTGVGITTPRSEDVCFKAGNYARFMENGNAIGSLAAGSAINVYNAYYSSGWKKIAGGWAAAWGVYDGVYYFYTSAAGAGSPDDAITWTVRFTLGQTGVITPTNDIQLANVDATSAFSAGFRGVPVVTKDAAGTFALVDSGKMWRHTDASAYAWTIPPNSSVAFPIGTSIRLRNVGSGAITLTRGAGVVLRSSGSSTDENKVLAQWADGVVTKEDTDTWVYSGSL